MSNNTHKVKTLFTIINNKTYNNTLLINITSNNSLLNDKSNNFLYLGIIILIISILILIFLFKKKKRVNVVNNFDLNRIIIKNPINNNPKIIISQKGRFQKVQNTSKVNDIVQPNNVLNEIKSHNLKDEIHKIINTSNSSGSSGKGKGKRGKRRRDHSSSVNNIGKGEISNGDGKKENNLIDKEEKKENIFDDINTQELENEIKQQIKKYVVNENNI